ncbi:hypothetical protein ABPG75_006768 [Micractinium tetrahymenae]
MYRLRQPLIPPPHPRRHPNFKPQHRYGSWPPPLSYTLVFARSPPYIAGMVAALVVHQAKQEAKALPTHRAPSAEAPPPGRADSVKSSRTATVPDGHCSAANGEAQAGMEGSAHASARQKPHATQQCSCGSGGSDCRLAQLAVVAADHAALGVVLGLAYCGLGDNRWIQLQTPAGNQALQVAGRWALGVALARLFTAMLQGRQRALAWLLSLDMWLPVAMLSFR